MVAEFRQLIRADMARRQLFRDGTGAGVPGRPDRDAAAATRRAGGAARRRSGGGREAGRRGRGGAPAHAPGTHGDVAFDDLRDADDLLAGSFEVLTTTGKYFWIPTERVQTLEFHAPKRPRDLLWRRASMSVGSGAGWRGLSAGDLRRRRDHDRSASGSAARPTGAKLDDGPVRGIGQRLFMVGEEALGIMDLGNIRFTV